MEMHVLKTIFLFLMVKNIYGFKGADYAIHETNIYDRSRSITNNTSNKTPWQVCANFLGGDAMVPQNCYCGGVLINSRWVLSGAHCFRSNSISRPWRKSQFQFVLGLSAGRNRQVLKAKNIILHEGYRPGKNRCVPGDNDVALIELHQNVKTDGQHVKVLPLPNVNANFDGMRCLIGDWDGSTGTDLSHDGASIPSNGICKINSKVGNKKALEGDSGGAVACGHKTKVVAGVIQFAKSCGGSGTFVPITGYLNWIAQNTDFVTKNGAGTRRKRTPMESSCFDTQSFPILRAASNRLMDACFGDDPETIEFRTLTRDESNRIQTFATTLSESTVNTFVVYNVRNLGNLFNLIRFLGNDGMAGMERINENHIIIRQFDGQEFRNGFLLTAGDFYCYPYRVNTNYIQPGQLTDGSYQNIYNQLTKNDVKNFNGYQQMRAFAGRINYLDPQSRHLAHFTFANLFAESVRNWNSLSIAVSFLNDPRQISSVTLFKNDIWPMIGGSWQQATWGRDTEATPTDTIKRYEKAMEEHGYQYYDEDVLEGMLRSAFCGLYKKLQEQQPDCCTGIDI